VADAARPAQRPAHADPRLHRYPPLSLAGERPFEVDPARLYEVGPAGIAWTGNAAEAELTCRRRHRLRWLVAIGLGVNVVTWTMAGLALAFGRGWGAAFGLLAVATSPLLALPALAEALARLRAWRVHRSRPDSFPH